MYIYLWPHCHFYMMKVERKKWTERQGTGKCYWTRTCISHMSTTAPYVDHITSKHSLWLRCSNTLCMQQILPYLFVWFIPEKCSSSLLRTNKLLALTCQLSSFPFRYFYFPTIKVFPSGLTPPFLSISPLSSTTMEICIPPFLERREREKE